jgi:hypothetical protein
MAITVAIKGTDLKFSNGNIINYYPSSEVKQKVVGTTIEIWRGGNMIRSDEASDYTHPSGSAEDIADAISELSPTAGGSQPTIIPYSQNGIVLLLDAADPESTIWAAAKDGYANKVLRKNFPSSTGTIYMSSTNVGDTTQTIDITYINSSGVQVTSTQSLNGQTEVNTGLTAYDINSACLSSDNDTLAGDVFFTLTSGRSSGVPSSLADTIAFINASSGITEQSTLRVPNDKKCIIKRLYISLTRSSGSDGSSTISFRYKPNGKSWVTTRYLVQTGGVIDKDMSKEFDSGTLIEVTTDGVSDTDTGVSVFFDYEFTV